MESTSCQTSKLPKTRRRWTLINFRLREKQEQRHQEEEKANGGEGEGNEEKYDVVVSPVSSL